MDDYISLIIVSSITLCFIFILSLLCFFTTICFKNRESFEIQDSEESEIVIDTVITESVPKNNIIFYPSSPLMIPNAYMKYGNSYKDLFK